MTTKTSIYPLRLPISLKAALEKLNEQDGASINQFVVMAVAEKISALNTASFLKSGETKWIVRYSGEL
jgi:hypothetical protein